MIKEMIGVTYLCTARHWGGQTHEVRKFPP